MGIAVVEQGGRYLVGERRKDQCLPGLAEFPGGRCREAESAEQCAVRECLEETGLLVRPVGLLLNRQFRYEHASVDLYFWLCRPESETAVAKEHNGFRWIRAADLAALEFPEANGPVIELIVSRADLSV